MGKGTPVATAVDFLDTKIAFESLTDQELMRSYWLFRTLGVNLLAKLGPILINTASKLYLPINWAIRSTIFKQFCGGESLEDCHDVIAALKRYGIGTILDFASERNRHEEQFEECAQEVLRSIALAKSKPEIAFVVFKTTAMARFELLEKISAKAVLSEEEKHEESQLAARIEQVCEVAAKARVKIFIDAEETWIQDAIDHYAEMMMQKYNRNSSIVYTTAQMYRTDRLSYLQQLAKRARDVGFRVGVKLVRGAYMEKERERASQKKYASPIQPNKSASDRDYNLALRFIIKNVDQMSVCIGTHNEDSTLLALKLMDEHRVATHDERIWFSQLYGMSDNLTYNLAHKGYKVAKYMPYGPVKAVLPYLMRRAQENSSIQNQTGRQLKLIELELKRRQLI